MQLGTLFRFATFLCLLASTLALAFAEAFQLFHSSAFYAAIVTCLIVAYFAEERWLMPGSLANYVAGAIFFAWLAWFVTGLQWEDGDPIGSILPRAGPLLGLLLLAKLFRPKQAVDYWLLHALALVQVLLALVLALRSRLDREQPLFAVFLITYVSSLVWSLTLFNTVRDGESGRPLAMPKRPTGRRPLGPALPWRTWGIASTMGWTLLAFVLGLVTFFAIPRPGQEVTANIPALLPGARSETGFNPGADLTQTGPISASDVEVMKVEAFDSEDRKVQLDADTIRFRGATCTEYAAGKWRPFPGPVYQNTYNEESRVRPANPLRITYNLDVTKLRPGSWFDQYDSTQNLSLFLLEPIYLAKNVRTPIAYPDRAATRVPLTFSYRRDEPSMVAPVSRRMRRLIYHQINAMPSITTPADQWSDEIVLSSELIRGEAGGARLSWWQALCQKLPDKNAQELLDKKASEILAKARVPVLDHAQEDKLKPSERRDLAVKRAKALEHYLVTSPDYGYALEHVRQDENLDPTVDFLCNVKQGHCELFASALALMLRSYGIPARVVIGFRGADYNSVGDWYEVRQYHAHAWVEAFFETEPPDRKAREATLVAGTAGRRIAGKWLTLDPTPAGGTAGASNVKRSGSLDDLISFVQFLWEFFVLDYSGDIQQEKLKSRLRDMKFEEIKRFWGDVFEALPRGLVIVAVVGIVATLAAGVWYVWRLRWRRRHAALHRLATSFPFYARFLKFAMRLGLRPMPSQTAAELSSVVAASMRQRPGVDGAADAAAIIASNFYDVRYGGYVLDATRAHAMDELLTKMELAVNSKS